jgi:hypothetical protein
MKPNVWFVRVLVGSLALVSGMAAFARDDGPRFAADRQARQVERHEQANRHRGPPPESRR